MVGAQGSAIGAARGILEGHHARSRTRSNGRHVVCSPVPVSILGSGCPAQALCQPWGGRSKTACSGLTYFTACAPTTECPPGRVLSSCATSCPHLCSHLQPGAVCVQEPCQLGCGCPSGQVGTGTLSWLLHGEDKGGEGGPSITGPAHLRYCTMARACPLLPARVPSSLCPGDSP